MWDSISAYLDTLNAMQICFLCAMVGGGLLLLFEIIISTIGGGIGDTSPDGIVEDLGTSDYAFKFFSLFSLSAFLFMSGCFGLWSYSFFPDSHLAAVIIALAAGIAGMLCVQGLTRIMLKLQSEGNVRLSNAVGTEGIVYLHIPQNAKGQVELILQGKKKFMPAITEDGTELATGTAVTVKAVTGNTLVVIPLSRGGGNAGGDSAAS